ncbi:MAG: hypothetical protein Q4F17_00305 [Eubacteriales bacterium]|nr:hypothetical protein [Eubacteriales bacterium]
MNAVKQRIEWVDVGKYVCIMFVMLSHLESGTEGLEKFYTPFFLSVFFFLSGYVYRQPASFRAHIAKKARGLLVPWFVFSTGSLLLSRFANYDPSVNYLARFGWNLAQIRGMGDEIWFVTALFVAYIPFYFFVKWNRPGWALGVMTALCWLSLVYCSEMPPLPWGRNALPWHLEFVFQAGLWMLLGYQFRQYWEKGFDKYNTILLRAGLWAVYLLLVYWPEAGRLQRHWRMFSVLVSLVGILAVVSICKVVRSSRYMRFVGANTLIYFALHGWVYASVELVLKIFAGGFYQACLASPWASNLLAVGITLVVSVLLMVPAVIINRWFPWMLGKWRTA